MKKFLTGMMVVVLGICFCAGTLLAGEKGKGDDAKKGPMIKGKVEVVKTGDAVTAINIVGKDKKVQVVLDDKGKELASLDGKYVVVRGTEADGKVTVAEFKGMPERAKKGKQAKKDGGDNKE
jgi:hypothetical protein